MKCKKYILVIVAFITLFTGMINVNAESSKTCYYMSEDGTNTKVRLKIIWDRSSWAWGATLSDVTKVSVHKAGGEYMNDDEGIANWFPSVAFSDTINSGSVSFGYFYPNYGSANAKETACPKYVVVESDSKTWFDDGRVYATNSKDKAIAATKQNNNPTFYASNTSEDGKVISKQDYFKGFVIDGIVISKESGELYCETLFSGKTKELINTALDYVRVIVPILIILLGTIDLSKAVIASNEDTMKKAQIDLVKRIIIGVAIFFVPVLVEVIMELATIVWEGKGYIGCPL